MSSGPVVQVIPTPYVPPVRNITSFTYTVKSFTFSVEITFSVFLYDENKQYIDNATVSLTGEDYSKWGTDDTYAMTYIAQQLGLTLVD